MERSHPAWVTFHYDERMVDRGYTLRQEILVFMARCRIVEEWIAATETRNWIIIFASIFVKQLEFKDKPKIS